MNQYNRYNPIERVNMATRLWGRITGGLLTATVLVACGGTATTATTTATVRRGDLTQSVSGSGQVKPLQDINLSFGTAGTIAQVIAREGQHVEQGAKLAALETSDLDQQVLQAEANLKSTQAALTTLKAGPKETDLRTAEAQLRAVLGEGVRLGPLDAVGMAISGAVAVAGVFVLSKYHPDAQGRPPANPAAVETDPASRQSPEAEPSEL